MPSNKTLIVIGGGAAGFFCAVNAARMNPQLEVIILEKTNKVLSKVKISGGGRCNVTHACYQVADMVARYPRGANFLKKAFHQFFTTDTIRWFEERGVPLKAEEDGRMFPVSDSSQSIIQCLLREADRYGVQVRMQSEVKGIQKEGDRFTIQLADGSVLSASYVCVAAGGYPKAAMFQWLQATGHTFEPPVPSLFTFNIPGHRITRLPGVSVPDVQVRINGSKLSSRGPLLITHWGLSGPAILRLSAWGARELADRGWQCTIQVNWLGDQHEQALAEQFQSLRFKLAPQKIVNRNPFGLPQRLWEFLLEASGVDAALRWADLPAKPQNRLIKNLVAQPFTVSGKTTFKEEFVTAGGIRLTEIDPQTMESRLVPSLFFAGEIMDVDGITGGFNFQHAWTSGYVAARTINEKAGKNQD